MLNSSDATPILKWLFGSGGPGPEPKALPGHVVSLEKGQWKQIPKSQIRVLETPKFDVDIPPPMPEIPPPKLRTPEMPEPDVPEQAVPQHVQKKKSTQKLAAPVPDVAEVEAPPPPTGNAKRKQKKRSAARTNATPHTPNGRKATPKHHVESDE